MSTQIISLQDFRKNMSTLWKKARTKKIRYLVMSHSQPVFEVKPIFSDEYDTTAGYTIPEYSEKEEREIDKAMMRHSVELAFRESPDEDEFIFDNSIDLSNVDTSR